MPQAVKIPESRGLGWPLLLALVFWLASKPTVFALWHLTWDDIEVEAHLDNTGALHVRERMFITVEGNVTRIERRIGTATDQMFLLRRLVRENDGQEMAFSEGWEKTGQYMWRRQVLTWWIRDETDPEFERQTMVYRFDYELRNALTPAWDIPVGPKSFLHSENRFDPNLLGRVATTMRTWAKAPFSFDRHYRLEHDVIYPLSWRGREEPKYTLRYDEAWRRADPESEIGRATPGSDFRVTQRLDYLAPGWPPAIDLWKPATRVGSILALTALAALLWLRVARRAIRRWGLTAPSFGPAWFEEQIASRGPEMWARVRGERRMAKFVAPFFERLRANGVIGVRSKPAADVESVPTIHLQLLRDSATLPPHEGLMLRALFPRGNESGSAVLTRHYAEPGFDLEEALTEAIDCTETATPSARPLFWRIVQRISPWLWPGALVLFVLDVIYGPPREELVVFACFFLAAFLLIGSVLWPLVIARFRVLSSGGSVALVSLVPIVLAVLALLVVQFCLNLPPTAYGSAGFALVALACICALLYAIESMDHSVRAQHQRLAALGRRYARRELKKARPGLKDAWIPHLIALGLEGRVARWRSRHGSTAPSSSSAPASAEPDFHPAHSFTGIAPSFGVEEEWIGALHVPSAEERREQAEFEAELKKAEEEDDDDE